MTHITQRRARRASARHTRQRVIGVVGALIVVAMIAAVAVHLATNSAKSAAAAPLHVGSTVPDFTLPLTTGQTFRLSAERGHVVVVYAMATWCASCAPGSQTLAQLYPRYHARGVDVLMVSVDPQDTPGSIAAFQSQVGAGAAALPWAIDRATTAERALDIQSLDQLVIIDRQGKVARIDEGAPAAEHLGQQLDQVLGGAARAPRPRPDRSTRTAGAMSAATTATTGCCP